MNTITEQQQQAIAARLAGMTLPSGLGTEESACSIAAINLALTGKLTDKIPHCMSVVIGRWIIPIQDAMPSEMRNSARWKSLLPLAAGTGWNMEQERLALIMNWMWDTVLPALQPMADRGGFGKEWLAMTTRRTEAAARVAVVAAVAAMAAFAAEKAEKVEKAAKAAAAVAAMAGAEWEAEAVALPADVAATAAVAAYAGETVARVAAWADTNVWTTVDPCGLLERLIRVGEQK